MKITIDVPAKSKKFDAIIAFFEAINIKYELPAKKEEKSSYNPEFVKKIEKSKKQAKEGKVRKVELDDIWKE